MNTTVRHNILIVAATCVVLNLGAGVGCAGDDGSETAATEGASPGAVEDNVTAELSWRPVTFTVPQAFARTKDSFLFSSLDTFRDHFGTSCGWFCTKPYEGPVNFSLEQPSGITRVLAYVNKPETPAGRDLVITRITRSIKRLRIETCTRPGTGKSYAFALVDARQTLPLIWADAPYEGEGLAQCPR
jgi:hypothetical protein